MNSDEFDEIATNKCVCVDVKKDKATLETHHQWLLHRKSGWKYSSGRRGYLSLSLPSSSAVSSAPSAVQNLLGRRASVMQRLFHKSTLSLHTEVTAV